MDQSDVVKGGGSCKKKRSPLKTMYMEAERMVSSRRWDQEKWRIFWVENQSAMCQLHSQKCFFLLQKSLLGIHYLWLILVSYLIWTHKKCVSLKAIYIKLGCICILNKTVNVSFISSLCIPLYQAHILKFIFWLYVTHWQSISMI